MWADFQAALRVLNSERSALGRLLSFPTAVPAAAVAQVVERDDFERASEFGVPVSLRLAPDTIRLGYDFDWFDAAVRYTWQFLIDADRAQVDAVANNAFNADARLVHRLIMNAIFRNTNRTNENGTIVVPLWNADGTVPPTTHGRTFTGTHSHYLTTGVTGGPTALDGRDIEVLVRHVTHHGYGTGADSNVIIFANEEEVDVMRAMRAGRVVNVGTTAAPVDQVTSWDFVPAVGQPAFLTTENIVGAQAPANFGGMNVAGSIGPAWVVENSLIPAGYLLAAGTAGANSPLNAVGFREHANADLRGLRQIPGSLTDYPLVNSFFSRGAGAGVRHRGAAVVMQIGTAYTVPAQFATV